MLDGTLSVRLTVGIYTGIIWVSIFPKLRINAGYARITCVSTRMRAYHVRIPAYHVRITCVSARILCNSTIRT